MKNHKVKATPLGQIQDPKEGKKNFHRQFVCQAQDGSREVLRLVSSSAEKLAGDAERVLDIRLFADAGMVL